jgi:cytochrome c biogenesis protein CcmG/thiol:disulfide interchange protein DsbE
MRNPATLAGVHTGVHPRRLALAVAAALAFIPTAALAVPRAGQPAPAFSLPALAGGKPVSLDSLKGKPVYVNFFASWCEPCNAEAPSIGQLRTKYAKRGVTVVGIDELDTRDRGAAFVKKNANPYSLVAFDEGGGVGRDYGAIAMPVHIFIDRRGVVTLYRLGEMNPTEIENAIKASLK